MIAFYQTSSEARIALLIALFISILLLLLLLSVRISARHKKWKLAVNVALFIAGFSITRILESENMLLETGQFHDAHGILVPVWVYWSVVVVLVLYSLCAMTAERKRSRNRLGPNAIKEALDTLPDGICYFTQYGTVKLCNLQMARLYRTMTQGDLQSLGEFHAAVRACTSCSGIIKTAGEHAEWLFPDGTAWLLREHFFTTKEGDCYTEVIFSNVTESYQNRLELEKQSRKLHETAQTFRTLTENVAEMTKEEEILLFKTRLHDRLGAGIVAARQILLQKRSSDNADSVIWLWKQSVEMLRQDNSAYFERSSLNNLMQDAAAIGIDILTEGDPPKSHETFIVFLNAIRECMVNGVRHASATRLYVRYSWDDETDFLSISNNGSVPQEKIVPGGGLTNLCRQVENLGGKMEIVSAPAFLLTISIPVTGGVGVETCTDCG